MKLYYEAIRALPEEWVDDHTQVLEFRGMIIAAHPQRQAMVYTQATKVWGILEIKQAPPPVADTQTPEQRRAAELAFRKRWNDDKVENMNHRAYNEWVDKLPPEEFLAMARMSEEKWGKKP